MIHHEDSIVAISTPQGSGALGVIRVSGADAISIVDGIFSKDISEAEGYSLHFGQVKRGEQILDEVLATVFRAPRSFTKEDVVEISCHGSPFILREVMGLILEKGARLAKAGEFTQRAYLNGAMDLAQAEAVADLIASQSAGAHKLAMNQMRGGVSSELKALREQLLNFTSLIELELDFSEEDVEFADRTQLETLVREMLKKVQTLIESFRLGNAIKQGVPTVIIGKPNAGKSTLLNTLLNDNRAIVSDIPGTTRDVIEDRVVIDGIEFRLMDTAGVRETEDIIEAEGVKRTLKLARSASLLIYLFDCQTETPEEAATFIKSLELAEDVQVLSIGNKLDKLEDPKAYAQQHDNDISGAYPWIIISAKDKLHMDSFRSLMVDAVNNFSNIQEGQTLISNARHLSALQKAEIALYDVQNAMKMGVSGDLLSTDIRTVLHHIGEITGEINTDEVLGNIFSKFCIGK